MKWFFNCIRKGVIVNDSSKVSPWLCRLLKECDYVKYWASGRRMYMWKPRNKVIRNKNEEDLYGLPIGSS